METSQLPQRMQADKQMQDTLIRLSDFYPLPHILKKAAV